jgi:hypothetical protein
MTDTLAELKAEAARLNARIAELERGQPPKPAPKPIEESGVRVVEILTETRALPTSAEMKKLFAAVKGRAPGKLDDKYDPDKPFRGFASAFRWLQNQGRLEQPNGKFALSYWQDACRVWLRQRNVVAGDVGGNEFAVLAAGDVPYVRGDLSVGHVWELGLAEYHNRGRKASDAWRAVMATGNVLAPSHPARSAPASHPVRMLGF